MTDTQRPWDRRTPESDPAYDAVAAYLEARWLDLWGRIYREALAIRIFPGFQKGLALLMKRATSRPSIGPGTLAAYARTGLAHAARRCAHRGPRTQPRLGTEPEPREPPGDHEPLDEDRLERVGIWRHLLKPAHEELVLKQKQQVVRDERQRDRPCEQRARGP